jgi:hypothetical protein
MIQLEKYHGTKSRSTCPNCGKRNGFTRFINTDTGEYLQDNVGICNRSSKCGYRYTAKQYFADNPTFQKSVKERQGQRNDLELPQKVAEAEKGESTSFDFIAPEHLKATLGNYDRNAFVQFLFNLFPDCSDEIQAVLKMYFVGTFDDYTCFPQIDRLNRVCKAKLIRFNRATGKRLKGDYDASSLVRKLKLKEDFNYKQIFFGEHLLRREIVKPVAVVESEKTAIIAHLCMPRFVWLATGSKQWLKVERLQKLDNRQIILYPDADGFDQWQRVATDAQRQGLNVKASALIENFATSEQKQNQYDLADYLIEQQTAINEKNEIIDFYNSKPGEILSNKSLSIDFQIALNERAAIIEIDGNLSRIEAETIAASKESIQQILQTI